MALIETLVQLVITLIVLIVLALPLYITVKLLGGKTGILRAIIVTLLTGFLFDFLGQRFPVWGWLVYIFLVAWIYHEVFRLRWLKAFAVFIVQTLVIIIGAILFGLLLGALGVSLAFAGWLV